MSLVALEKRVAALEQQVAALKTQHANGAEEKPWLRTMGVFAGDEVMKEIFDEALKYREQDRQRGRPLREEGRQTLNKQMILLDTDHLTAYAFPESGSFQALSAKIRDSEEEFGTTIVCLEEQLRGWLAAIKRKQDVHQQIAYYDRLRKLWDTFRDWNICRFDDRAANHFKDLRKQKVRIGAQDLKIAAIAFVNDALLLSANLRDFRKVPGLRVENWLES